MEMKAQRAVTRLWLTGRGPLGLERLNNDTVPRPGALGFRVSGRWPSSAVGGFASPIAAERMVHACRTCRYRLQSRDVRSLPRRAARAGVAGRSAPRGLGEVSGSALAACRHGGMAADRYSHVSLEQVRTAERAARRGRAAARGPAVGRSRTGRLHGGLQQLAG